MADEGEDEVTLLTDDEILDGLYDIHDNSDDCNSLELDLEDDRLNVSLEDFLEGQLWKASSRW